MTANSCLFSQINPRCEFMPFALPKLEPREAAAAEHRAQIAGYMNSWVEYIPREKTRQMGISDKELWPKVQPWNIENVQTMPSVAWLRRDKKSVLPREGATTEEHVLSFASSVRTNCVYGRKRQ